MTRGRKPTLSARAKKKLEALLARGGTQKSITAALVADGIDVSESTVARAMKAARGPVAASRVGTRSDTLRAEYADAVRADVEPESSGGDLPKPEAIPEGADLEQIKGWLERADKLGKIAFAKGDLAGMGQMGRLTSALLEAKRRATPPEKPDPKDDPNMAKIAAEARAKLHKYIDQALGRAE